MIHLDFLSGDPEEIALAQRYWGMDSNGRFTSTVADLLPFRSATNPKHLAPLLRQIATAYDLNQQCPRCAGYEQIASRTQEKKRTRPCAGLVPNVKRGKRQST